MLFWEPCFYVQFAFPDIFLCTIFDKKSPEGAQREPKVQKKGIKQKRWKMDAEKGTKSMQKGFQNDAKVDAKIVDVSFCDGKLFFWKS